MSGDRLQKVLARAGVASRRKAEDLIRAGRVTVNGAVATLGQRVDAAADAIKVDGKRVVPASSHRYLLLNKPRGYITSHSDPEGRQTVYDLIPAGLRRALIAVGRLDLTSEGLLILTDDGDFAQRVAHPRHGCKKTYHVKVRGTPDARALERLRGGLVLDGRKTAPAVVESLRPPAPGRLRTNSWWSVKLAEGRTRQIREMFERVGHPVQKLKRVAIGGLSDPDLPLGYFRELSDIEVAALAGRKPPRPPGRRRKRAG